MSELLKTAPITKPTDTVAARIKVLAAGAVGLVDRQTQLDLDNCTLFAQTALFVREMLADIAKVKEFVNVMKALEVKMPPDLKKIAGMDLTDKEKSKLGQSNMLLPIMRTIFHDKGGKLRSFENYAYPMTQLLKDETLVSLDQITDAIKNAVHIDVNGKKTTGIEALRKLERESREAGGARGGNKPSEIPVKVNFMKGRTTLSKEIVSDVAFDSNGFGLMIVRKASDGGADILFGATDVAGLVEIVAKAWEKVKDAFELDPRFKTADLPEGFLAALNLKAAA